MLITNLIRDKLIKKVLKVYNITMYQVCVNKNYNLPWFCFYKNFNIFIIKLLYIYNSLGKRYVNIVSWFKLNKWILNKIFISFIIILLWFYFDYIVVAQAEEIIEKVDNISYVNIGKITLVVVSGVIVSVILWYTFPVLPSAWAFFKGFIVLPTVIDITRLAEIPVGYDAMLKYLNDIENLYTKNLSYGELLERVRELSRK